jgi:4-hydroxy-tetrahydrodipicolinate synthase
VPITLGLIERLLKRYPGTVAGVKDSSGDWSNTKAMLDAFAKSGFDVFAGSEVFLLDNMKNGGVGCITATGNINPAAIDRLFRNWQGADAGALQQGVTATRNLMQKYPMMAALKAVIAHYGRDPEWTTVRPPLVELTPAQSKSLAAELEAIGFDMPGLAKAAVAA